MNCNSISKPKEVSFFFLTKQYAWPAFFIASCLGMTFVLGYWAGRQEAMQAFCLQNEQESLAAMVYSSMCSLYGYPCDSDGEEKNRDGMQENSFEEQLATQQEVANHDADGKLVSDEMIGAATVKSYYAELVGFGTQRAAEQFKERLKEKEIVVIIKRRQSRLKKGKSVAWYQIVTETVHDEGFLLDLIQKIQRYEHIKDIQVKVC